MGESRDLSWIILDLLIHSASVDTDVSLLYGLKVTQISRNLSVAFWNGSTELPGCTQPRHNFNVMFYSSHVNVVGWGLCSWAIRMLPASAKPWQQNKDTHTHTHTHTQHAYTHRIDLIWHWMEETRKKNSTSQGTEQQWRQSTCERVGRLGNANGFQHIFEP